MIGTDRYEGHTKGPWIATDFEQLPFLMNKANEKLIHDAPDLLAEVKRLREENESLRLNMMGKSSEHWMLCSYEGIQRLHAKHDSSLAEVKRLRHELLLILSDFETKKTDMYEMRNRIETILKGDD